MKDLEETRCIDNDKGPFSLKFINLWNRVGLNGNLVLDVVDVDLAAGFEAYPLTMKD
ncbi:hypothetical protein [Paracoccus sp. S4493]|uniref:hypothetical protein n=1 Tax=Paracoccus sp. S4493 TaxID=579490 RepID=UPI000B056AAE|nr:hypothetical protein [Paracoccus sp. S4493]